MKTLFFLFWLSNMFSIFCSKKHKIVLKNSYQTKPYLSLSLWLLVEWLYGI